MTLDVFCFGNVNHLMNVFWGKRIPWKRSVRSTVTNGRENSIFHSYEKSMIPFQGAQLAISLLIVCPPFSHYFLSLRLELPLSGSETIQSECVLRSPETRKRAYHHSIHSKTIQQPHRTIGLHGIGLHCIVVAMMGGGCIRGSVSTHETTVVQLSAKVGQNFNSSSNYYNRLECV